MLYTILHVNFINIKWYYILNDFKNVLLEPISSFQFLLPQNDPVRQFYAPFPRLYEHITMRQNMLFYNFIRVVLRDII